MSRNQAELIRQLRTMREQKGLTYQAIVDSCESAGEAVSLSSVRRIFTCDPDRPEEFRESTLQAVTRAVMGESYTQTEPASDVTALRAMLAVREEADRERQQGIIDRTEQISRMQSTIEEQQAEIKRKSRTIKIMITWAAIVSILLIFVAAGLFSYLIWDYLHPDIGMIQR